MNLDVRRSWVCPACGRCVKRLGEITTYRCPCQDPPAWMRLVEGQRAHREYQPYIVPEIKADELIGDEDPLLVESSKLEEAVAVVESLSTEEAAAVMELLEPAEIEMPPADDDFFSPEDEGDENPPASEPGETAISETAPDPVESSEPSPDNAAKEQPRPGKSRRRRSGRKRSRHPGSQEGGGEGG